LEEFGAVVDPLNHHQQEELHILPAQIEHCNKVEKELVSTIDSN